MIPQPMHGRKLGLLGVALTMQRENRFEMVVFEELQDEIEQIMIDSQYLNTAPFSWVTLSIRFGLKNDIKPSYQKVDKKYGDLPLTIEIDTHETIEADKESIKNIIKKAILVSLLHAGKKHNLNTQSLEEALASIIPIVSVGSLGV